MPTAPVVYAEFSKGGWRPGDLKIMKTKRKISPLRISPFSCPKLREDRKKGLCPDSVLLCAQTFCLSYKWRMMPQFCKLFDANYTILVTQRGDGTMLPLNTPLHCAHCVTPKKVWSVVPLLFHKALVTSVIAALRLNYVL